MDICHPHNLNVAPAAVKPYGVRVTLPPGDPFVRLLGPDWQRLHWYATPEERDRELREMSSEHLYSRRGDRPSLRFDPVDRSAAG